MAETHPATLDPAPIRQARPALLAADELVLVADDDGATRTLVSRFLQKAGFQVIAAADGADVLRLLAEVTPTLLLLDCEMPGKGGFELCAELRGEPRFEETPIVFLTGLTAANHVARGFAVGGNEYITKPVSRRVLLARIENQLELARNRRLLQRQAALFASVNQEQTQSLLEVRSGQQQMLTPASAMPRLKLAVEYHPAHIAGGDFYELLHQRDETYLLLVADVSGHDLSVPYTTGALKALTGVCFLEDRPLAAGAAALNGGLSRFLHNDLYVTSVMVLFDRATGVCEVLSAGHPPVVVQRAGGACELIELRGDVLGMFDEPRFEARRIALAPGDRIFLYSDGLLAPGANESNPLGLGSGLEWLQARLAQYGHASIEEAAAQLMAELERTHGGVPEDDVVLIGCEY